MKSTLIRTALVTSLITALGVSALAFYAFPHFVPNQSLNAQTPDDTQSGVTMMSATYHPPVQSYDSPRPRVVYRNRSTGYSGYSDRAQTYSEPQYSSSGRDAYGEPIRRQRTTEKSALIVAGSAGTGAAIGALAGGGRGAAIGALAGGAAGFIYDRMTANPNH